jgi:hypothetical protein
MLTNAQSFKVPQKGVVFFQKITLLPNLVVLIATGLAGVALVAANDAWGSASDVITALLGGFGARIVLGEVGTASRPSPSGPLSSCAD